MKQLEQKRVDLISEAEPNLLVARALDGCQDCYSELATRYFPRLVQLVLPRVSSRNLMDAEDVAQESLKRAFENLATFDPQYRFTTWLYTIAIRIAIDHNRHYRRRATLLAAHRELAETRAADDRVADHACESVENADVIWEFARQRLSKSQYTAMWLRFSEDLSVGEIARVMRKTNVGVRVLLHRARLNMLKELSKEDAYQTNGSSEKRT